MIASLAGANTIAIAEAKGSHNTAGPDPPLNGAKEQVNRIDILSGTVALVVKRYAIATRWSVQNNPGLLEPWLVVHDPQHGEREPTRDEKAWLVRSTALGHYASLAQGFGLRDTAAALWRAKLGEPGHLELPTHEMTVVDRDGSDPITIIGAAIVPSAVVPLPLGGDIEDFRAALQTVFGERTMLLAIPTEELYRADAAYPMEHDAQLSISPQPEVLFWSATRSGLDGSIVTPLRNIALRRAHP
ncbi:MAG TPA: hypothetical protein VKG91_12125 [Roseiarcus sp.]|nr:hypothetical protein [Roseiarcus sp.]